MLVENQLKNYRFDLSLFIGQIYFFNDRAQLFLIIQALYYILKRPNDTEKIISSKVLSIEKRSTLTITKIDQMNMYIVAMVLDSIWVQKRR